MKIAQRRSLKSHLQAKYRFGSGRAFLLDCGFNANGPCIIPVWAVGPFSVPFGGILLSLLGGECGEDLMTLDRRKNKRAIRAAKLRSQRPVGRKWLILRPTTTSISNGLV